jgi:hypothetical protein
MSQSTYKMLCSRRIDLYVKPVLSEIFQRRQLVRCSEFKPVADHSLLRARNPIAVVNVGWGLRQNWLRTLPVAGKMQMTSAAPNIVAPASFGQQDQARY